MSTVLLVRSIPLSHTTRTAWKNAGGIFASRSRQLDTVPGIAYGRPVINLGNNAYRPYHHAPNTWNKPEDIEVLLSPSNSRELFGRLLPSDEFSSECESYWIKGPGRGGANKEKVTISGVGDFDWRKRMLPQGYDIQQHVNGQEYRVITVANKVVQSSRRYGTNGDRTYEWCGLGGTPTAVKSLARHAAGLLQDINIIGWDIIDGDDDAPYLLEGNACPGLNDATAQRIVNTVVRFHGEE